MESAPAEKEFDFQALVKQLSKFIVVGVINTGIDFLVLNIEMKITGIASGPVMFYMNTISFGVATINSYFMNKLWTFQDKDQTKNEVKFTEFIAVSVVGAGINSSIVAGITTFIPPIFGLSAKMWANVAKLGATGISLIWNFIGYKLFVFKK